MTSQARRALGRSAAVSALGLTAALGAPAPAQAQIPRTFTNLEVLPKETARQDLIDLMRSFAGALGVRCNHCHVGQNPDSLEGFDFASDEKEPKRVARAMMKMTREINERLLPATGRSDVVEVRCVTCHRGLQKPQTLDRVLMAAVEKDGADAALKLYRELREKHYGQGTYDFGPRTLSVVAEHLARRKGDVEGGLLVMEANVNQFPDDGNLRYMIGEMYLRKGDQAAALASFKRCLALQPDNEWARAHVKELTGPKKAD